MGTLNAFYVRVGGDLTIATIRKKFPYYKVECGEHFIGVTLPQKVGKPPLEDLKELSSWLNTEIMWLSFQSVVDGFQFYHWRSGTVLRSLVFGCYKDERTWELADGKPEEWEGQAFFDQTTLLHLIKSVKSDKEKLEIERIWGEAELLPGRTVPSINSRESARTIAEYYHFPGWS